AVAADSVRLQLSCNRGAPSYNMGDLDERLALHGSEAVFRTTEFGGRCVLRFRFVRRGAIVAQEGNDAVCGFGYGVFADGTYRLVSRRRTDSISLQRDSSLRAVRPNVALQPTSATCIMMSARSLSRPSE